MSLYLKLLAPWLSVIVFWCVFESGWLALLGYHLQIVFWNRGALGRVFAGFDTKGLLAFALPAMVAGPAMYFLLPYLIDYSLSDWLARYHLSGWAIVAMIPYFGCVHPLLEQVHWQPLWTKTPLAYFMFAGYHLLVLYTLLPTYLLIVAFVALSAVAVFWRQLAARNNGVAIPYCSHMMADLGIITAAYCLIL